MIIVHNIATSEVYEFDADLGNIEALVSAAIQLDNQVSLLTDEDTRQRYRQQVKYGNLTASIENLYVLL